MRFVWKITLFICLGLGMYSSATAGRPFMTDDPGIVEINAFETELTGQYGTEGVSLGWGLKHGITESMDLGISFGHGVLPEEDAVFDALVLGVKYLFLPDCFAVSINFEPGIAAYSILSMFRQSLGSFILDLNLGFMAEPDEKNVEALYCACLTYNSKNWSIGIEVTGEEQETMGWLTGVQYHLNHAFSIDSGIGGTLENNATWYLTSGISFGFKPSFIQEEE